MAFDLAPGVRVGLPVLFAALVISACATAGPVASSATTASSSLGIASTLASEASVRATKVAAKSVASPYRFTKVQIGGGGWVTGVVVHPSQGLRFARTDVGGVFRWNPAKSEWSQLLLSPGLADPQSSDYNVESLSAGVSDPSVVYAAVGGDQGEEANAGRVLVSRDAGQTWKSSARRWFISGNAENRQIAERLSVDPAQPKRALLGTRTEGLWLTEDFGANWARLESLPAASVGSGADRPGVSFALILSGSKATARGFSAVVGVSGAGAFLTDLPEIAEVIPLDAQVVGSTLWMSVASNSTEAIGSVVSIDLNSKVVTNRTPPPQSHRWAIAVHPKDPNLVIASDTIRAEKSLWLSRDGGANWTQTPEQFVTAPSWLKGLGFDGCVCLGNMRWDSLSSNQLYFANGTGVWRGKVESKSVNFEFISTGIEETVATDAVVAGDGSLITTIADFQGYRHKSISVTPGSMLTNNKFANGSDIDFMGRNRNVLVWVGAEYHIYWEDSRKARAARSLDGGQTWEQLPNLDRDLFGGNVAISATDQNNIVWLPSYFINPFEYQESPKALAVTTDGGGSWKRVQALGSSSYHRLHWWTGRQALAADKVAGATFYLLDETRTLGVSTDGGLTWVKAAHAPPCDRDNACHVFGQLRAAPDVARTLYASVGSGGLWKTTDAGATPWRRVGTVAEVRQFAFGAPRNKGGVPALFVYGRKTNGAPLSVMRSDDDGVTWVTVARYPGGFGASVTALAGDPTRWGRVFIGFGGLGFVQGETVSTASGRP
jgi:hypothetical protein